MVLRPSFTQLWQVPLFFLGILALIGVWVARPYWYDPETRKLKRDLAGTRRMLEEGRASANGLVALAADTLARIDRLPDRSGEAHFLLGSAYLRLAGQLPQDRSQESWRSARIHLEQAELLGVADSDRAQLLYRLGKAGYHTGAEPQRVIGYLAQCLDELTDERKEGYGILAQSYLRLNDLPSALQANQKQLQLPTEDENSLAPARLLRGELLLRLPDSERHEEARKVLARIGAGAPPKILAQARYLSAHSYQDEGAWAEAAALWSLILSDKRERPAEAGRILYWLGWCYHNLHREVDAVHAWEQAMQQGGEPSQAAALRVAEVRLKEGNLAGALGYYERALAEVTKPENFRNALLDLSQARSLLSSACQVYQKAGNFEKAQAVAQLHTKLVSGGPAQILLGQVAEAWARAQTQEVKQTKDGAAARRIDEAARTHFREAGAAYEAAVDALTDNRNKNEWLWRAADCYLLGQDFTRAVAVLENYVKLQPPLERLSEAWYWLGQAHQALHHDAAAGLSYLRCIEYPGPIAYRARYQLAVAEIERGKLAEAEEMLRQNLALMLEPDREAHEKTLYTFAHLLFLRGNYHQATQRWEQALTLYPANAEVLAARFELGECYRRLADIERISAQHPEAAPDVVPHFRKQYILWLETAAANYQKLCDDLEARRSTGSLTEDESTLLRESLRALADCRFERGQYEEASRLYDNFAGRYQQDIEALQALRQLWRCQVLLLAKDKSQLDKAHETLRRASIILNRLPDTVFKGRPESESRPAWEKWIRDSETQLNQLGF